MTPLGHRWKDALQYIAASYGREMGKLNSTRGVWWYTRFYVNGPQLPYGSIDIRMRTTLVWTRAHIMMDPPAMYSPVAVSFLSSPA